MSHVSTFQYNYKGSIVTGKLFKKVGTEAKPVWIVTPTDRRRKNEEISERALGKVINAQEAMSNRGPKLKKSNKVSRELSQTSNSDFSLDEVEQAPPKRNSSDGRTGSSSEENSKADGSSTKKRKSDDSNTNSGSDMANKNRKTVTFSRESSATAPSKKKFKKPNNKKANKVASTRIGTRSSRGSGAEMVLLPELPVRKKQLFKTKKVKKDENVTVVKMLTGTLYLYRGDRPRAEFVRSK